MNMNKEIFPAIMFIKKTKMEMFFSVRKAKNIWTMI